MIVAVFFRGYKLYFGSLYFFNYYNQLVYVSRFDYLVKNDLLLDMDKKKKIIIIILLHFTDIYIYI